MRNTQQYDLNWFNNYAQSMGIVVPDINLLSLYISQNYIDVLDFLDHKFELIVIFDKNNNFIKVI